MKYKLMPENKQQKNANAVQILYCSGKIVSDTIKVTPNPAIIASTNEYGICFTVNFLPSLLKKVSFLIKLVLLKITSNNGVHTKVLQLIQEPNCSIFSSNLTKLLIANPADIPNQNTKFHIRSLLSHFSGPFLGLTWIKGLISPVVAPLVKFCIVPSANYSSKRHYIIPNISLLFKQILLVLSGIILTSSPNAAYSATKDEILELISRAEQENNIPRGLLLAVSKIESNLQPFALNIKGQTILSKDENHALQNIRQALNAGITNIDIGIMQLNYKWHHHNFTSLEDMLKLETNIKYAAELLVKLKQAYGDWHTAVRHYHSLEPKYHKKYSRKIVLCWLANN